MVSEWNTPSLIRDTPQQKSFFVKSQMEMAKTGIDNNMVAAWQDFSQSANEFHSDFGLLSYGSIHKPAYNALLLANKLKGNFITNTSSASADLVSTVTDDTLNILVTNYVPLAFIEAFNHTLFEGKFNANQLDSAGYIDIPISNLSRLDSIYQGQLTVPSTTAINTAINNSIPIYNHFDSLQHVDRQFILNVAGLHGVHTGINYTVNSTHNNLQFKYDSLLAQGFDQASAINYVTANQSLVFSGDSLLNGQTSFSMEPNSVQLFQFIIPEVVSVDDVKKEVNILIFPNPTEHTFTMESEEVIGKIQIYDTQGKMLKSFQSNQRSRVIDLSKYPAGVYFVKRVDSNATFKVIKTANSMQ